MSRTRPFRSAQLPIPYSWDKDHVDRRIRRATHQASDAGRPYAPAISDCGEQTQLTVSRRGRRSRLRRGASCETRTLRSEPCQLRRRGQTQLQALSGGSPLGRSGTGPGSSGLLARTIVPRTTAGPFEGFSTCHYANRHGEHHQTKGDHGDKKSVHCVYEGTTPYESLSIRRVPKKGN